MSTTHGVDLGGVHVRGAWNAPGGGVVAELAVYTQSGQARIAQLDEQALLGLADQCIDALKKLQVHRRQNERAELLAPRPTEIPTRRPVDTRGLHE